MKNFGLIVFALLAIQTVARADLFGGTSLGVNDNSVAWKVASVSVNYSAGSSDRLISASATNSTTTVTLPLASAQVGQIVSVFKSDTSSYPVIVTVSGSDLVNGSTGTVQLDAQGQTLTVVSDGSSKWFATEFQKTPARFPVYSYGHTNTAAIASSTTFVISQSLIVPTRVTGCIVDVNVQSGNIDCGIYDQNGVLLAHTGSVACPAQDIVNTPIAFTTAVNLQPGIYYLALSANTGTPTYRGGFQFSSCSTVTSNFPLANTTLPGTAQSPIFVCPNLQMTVSGGRNY